VLRRPPSSPPHGPLSPSLPILAFPHGENPLASLYLLVPLILFFMASSALAACARELWPPAMASAALAHSSGHFFALAEFPSSSAFSRCLRISEPWPVGLWPRAPVTSMPPAMEFAAGGTVPTGQLVSLSPSFDSSRPFSDQRSRLEDTSWEVK